MDSIKWTSREQVTVLHGQVLVPGTVIGKLIAAAQAAAAASGNAGNGTVTGVSLSSDFKVGVYAFSCSAAASNGGTFKVEDPDGDILGDATVGAGFTSPQINFTINDGTNDFHVGDSFTLAVNAADGQVKALDLSAVNGSQRAYGAMIAPADATAADVPGVAVTNRAVLKESGLVWPAGITDTQKAAALAQLKEKFITVRKGA